MERNSASRQQLVQMQLDVANAQNVRLSEENQRLQHKLEYLTKDKSSNASINVEARILALKMEDERDNMYENLEMLKKKYNKLHDAYLEKVKRCKALEKTFEREKTLTGLVMKSALAQRQQEQNAALEQRAEKTASVNLELLAAKLKKDLDEAYDIIDDLEFELESIDFLEMENQRLQNELRMLKSNNGNANSSANSSNNNNNSDANSDQVDAHTHARDSSAASSECENCLYQHDVDGETLERVVLTETLIKTAEAESNCLRRELLRSRLQRAFKQKPTLESSA